MVSNFVYDVRFGIGTAKVSTTDLIADLEKKIKGKDAGDMITINFSTEGRGDRPTVTCPAEAIEQFISLLKEEEIIVEKPSIGYYSFLGLLIPSVAQSAAFSSCKISIPKACELTLWDMLEVSSCIPSRIKIEKEKLQDGTTNYFLSPALEKSRRS
jgi:hypothetical protein